MNTRLIYFTLFMTLLTSCAQKEPPVDAAEEHTFSITGSIDHLVTTIYAGESDFYMATDFAKNAENVFEFTGDLKKTCANCRESFRVTIRNYKQNTNDNDYSVEEAFNNDYYPYHFDGSAASSYWVSFKGEPKEKSGTTHLWDFGDGTKSTDPYPQRFFAATGNYLITYTASFAGGCSSTISYPLNLSASASGSNNLGFGYTYLGDGNVYLSTDSSFTNILWDLGGGNTSTSRNLTIPLHAGVKKITLMRFSGADTIISVKNIPSENYTLCNANFIAAIAPQESQVEFSTITVEWTDAAGNLFSSGKVKQDAGQWFRILSSSPYLTNAKGLKTRTLNIQFNCKLSDGTRTIEMNNMQGKIAVAHP